MADSCWYPSVDDVLTIHADIVSEYPDTEAGVRRRGDIEFALDYIQEGHLDATTERIHVQAFHLLRLLVANHRSSTPTSAPPSTRPPSSTR